jgi:hypothetical protein
VRRCAPLSHAPLPAARALLHVCARRGGWAHAYRMRASCMPHECTPQKPNSPFAHDTAPGHGCARLHGPIGG